MNWNALIEDIVAGRWTDPTTDRPIRLPFEAIELVETTDGREAELVGRLALGRRHAVVSDATTVEVMGRRVAAALRAVAAVDEIVLPDGIKCDEPTIAEVQELTRHADAVIAVGAGVINDCCKHATFLDGRRYAVFGTAASMNGYGASTASVTLASGLKASLPSHTPAGLFLDLGVAAAAPTWLSAAGLGDCLCRSTAQTDWWTAHRLFGTPYSATPYALMSADEEPMLSASPGLARHDIVATGHLQRVLTLCSIGVAVTGVSNHGSMGEHQISHWVDMFAGGRRKQRTTHGQQVGVASIVMARLQAAILGMPQPPVVRATTVNEADMLRRYGPQIGPLAVAEMRKTALDEAGADRLNERLSAIWPQLRAELAPTAVPPAEIEARLRAVGAPATGEDLGLPAEVWRDAIRYSREIRGRWSFVNLAADSGMIDRFLESEH